jgi:CRISPR-associated protein Cst1
LIRGESIVRYFFKGEREVFGNWELLKFYLKEVKEMDEKRINAIRDFADRIADLISRLNDVKRLFQLETVKDYSGFRNVLRFLAKDAVKVGMEEPLIKFDEYVGLILPDGAMGWNEVRDLLLFRIYEQLHDWLKSRGSEIIEGENL